MKNTSICVFTYDVLRNFDAGYTSHPLFLFSFFFFFFNRMDTVYIKFRAEEEEEAYSRARRNTHGLTPVGIRTSVGLFDAVPVTEIANDGRKDNQNRTRRLYHHHRRRHQEHVTSLPAAKSYSIDLKGILRQMLISTRQRLINIIAAISP